jgi:hypothetical protein
MNPGEACIACHASVEGPYLAVAGTLYATPHEPNLCYGFAGANAQVVVIGADGQQVALVRLPSSLVRVATFLRTLGRSRRPIRPKSSTWVVSER